MSNQYLFIYGTLLQSGNEFALYLQKNSTVHSKGKFKGRLYDIGEYPGAVLDKSGSYVYGNIVLLNDPVVLNNLDIYEGYGSKQPKPNLFIRKLISAETDNVPLKCWVYLYNLPLMGLHLITSGDYLSHQKGKKNPPDQSREERL